MNFFAKINFKLNRGFLFASVLCFAVILGMTGIKIQASLAEATDYTCSNATLKGAYGHYVIGTKGTQAPFIPYDATRTAIFDGKGHSHGHGFSNVAGLVREYSVTSTYQVAPDCTVKINNKPTFKDGSGGMETQLFAVIVDRGHKVYGVHLDHGDTVTVYFERMY